MLADSSEDESPFRMLSRGDKKKNNEQENMSPLAPQQTEMEGQHSQVPRRRGDHGLDGGARLDPGFGQGMDRRADDRPARPQQMAIVAILARNGARLDDLRSRRLQKLLPQRLEGALPAAEMRTAVDLLQRQDIRAEPRDGRKGALRVAATIGADRAVAVPGDRPDDAAFRGFRFRLRSGHRRRRVRPASG